MKARLSGNGSLRIPLAGGALLLFGFTQTCAPSFPEDNTWRNVLGVLQIKASDAAAGTAAGPTPGDGICKVDLNQLGDGCTVQ